MLACNPVPEVPTSCDRNATPETRGIASFIGNGCLGAGAEYAFFGNWSAKLEYDYIHFADQQAFLQGTITEISPVLGTGTTSLPNSGTLRTSLQLHQARHQLSLWA